MSDEGTMTRVKRRIGIENPSAADDGGNVGIVRGALRAFGEGDMDAFLDCLKPDVTWEAPGGNFPGDESYDGRDEIKDGFVADVGRTYVAFGFKPEKFIDAPDENAVVVFGTFSGEGRAGEGLDDPAVMVWQFEGSEAEHVRVYADSAKFPEVVTEEKEKEWEEEAKEEEEEKEESEAKGDDDSSEDDDSDSEDKDDDDSDDTESKSEESSESKSDESSESKSDESSESKSDDDSESKSDDDSESKSDDDSESSSEDEKEKSAKSDG
jgi:ketosteroid isomerase-like protein